MWGPGKRPFINLANAVLRTGESVHLFKHGLYKVLQGSNQEKVGLVFEERETASHVANHELLMNPDI